MAQAALESGWGEKAIGNNLFGIKYRKGDFGYQKVLTTEYSPNKNAYNGQEVKSIEYDSNKKLYKFKVWQYFADYPTPKEAFLAHSQLLLTERYKYALRWKDNPTRYLIAIWQAGYATDPEYGIKMINMIKSIENRIPKDVRKVIETMNTIKRIEPGRLTGEIEKELKLEEKLKNRIK
jgi:flagellar protein FlgJ